MQEAIVKIRKHFGSDAVILDSKTIRSKGVSGLFKKKMVEVVAAYEPDKKKKNESSEASKIKPEVCAQSTKQKSNDDTNVELLNEQLKELKSVVQDFTNRITLVNNESTLTFLPEILSLFNTLIERDVHEDLAKEIATQTQEARNRKSMETDMVVQQLIMEKLGEPIPLKLKKFKQNVLLFAGPTGAGKTTTLVKLAGMLTFNRKLNVGFINMDTYRVGAIENINIYSEIMDIPLRTAFNLEELKEALKSLEDKDVILIDTAGKSSLSGAYKKDIEEYIQAVNVDEVFLVLGIVTSFNACKDFIRNFSLVDYKLIITKLDEVSAWGNILNITDYAKKPISYITMGQEVPNDICQVDMRKIADNITGREVIL